MDEVKKLLREAFSAAAASGVLIEDVNFDFATFELTGDEDMVILNGINFHSRFTKDKRTAP